ncbi:MAG: hypothetical protein ACYC1L_03230 [Alphaproteobacteria bacterium]
MASWAVLTVLFAAAPAVRADDGFRETPEAVQTVYRDGAPHTTRQGVPRLAYDAGESFFPIGIYNGLMDAGDGRDGFALYASAGFNSVFPWRDQNFDAVLTSARANGLQLVVRDPTDAELARFADDPAVLGYDLDHEPTVHARTETALWRLEAFQDRRAAVRALDPRRPVFTVDSPGITPPYRNSWLAYAEAGDLVCFWKYPFFDAPVRTMTGPRGLPEVTALAARTAREQKPVWYVAQAFRSPVNNWFMPDEMQARAMVYAGLIHGATGIVWFTHDSYSSRDGRVIGASPDPKPDYKGPDRRMTGAPLHATARELAESRRMWGVIEGLNAELAALAPAILSPTSARNYRIAVHGRSVSPTPIRALLKDGPDGPMLLVVNIDAEPVEARFSFEAPLAALEPVFGAAPAPAVAGGGWTERIEGWGVRVYRLR